MRGSSAQFADFRRATLTKAKLGKANLRATMFHTARMQGADLHEADLAQAVLFGADLRESDLRKAELSHVDLIDANLQRADLTGARVFGASAWNVRLDGAIQRNLVITRRNQPKVTVDNIEIAQFIYLLLNNAKIRDVIDTITSKVVLILGRFMPERKIVLDAIREELRSRNYIPVLFDFEKPASRDLTGTVSTLANMARFIVADLTDPSSVPHELATLVPTTVVPVQTILLEGQREYAMFADLRRRYHWVLKPVLYKDQQRLLEKLDGNVIAPAEAKAKLLAGEA